MCRPADYPPYPEQEIEMTTETMWEPNPERRCGAVSQESRQRTRFVCSRTVGHTGTHAHGHNLWTEQEGRGRGMTDLVTLDGVYNYPCVLDRWEAGPRRGALYLWNGFVCPRFDRKTVEQIVADIEADGYEEDDKFAWEGDVLLVTTPAYEDEDGYQPERVEPDEDGLYPLGNCSWTWSEAE